MLNSHFQGKKILFFAPSFFNYEKIIKNKLETLGAKVVFYDDRPSNSIYVKALIRLKKNLLKTYINTYYKKIATFHKNNSFDYVFFLKGESITVESLELFKEYFSEAKFILYLFDSIQNNNNLELYNHFDKILSFDKGDTEKYSTINFRPLFYDDLYANIGLQKIKEFEYFTFFVGTAHTDRINVVKRILDITSQYSKSNKVIMFLPGKLLYWYRKIFDIGFKGVKINDIQFEPISHNELTEFLKKSFIVIDIQHPGQTGLTMRSLETLGAKKKLITTNPQVLNYEFYRKSNICVIDRLNPIIPKDFLLSEYEEIPEDIYKKYSLEYWLNDCFEI